MAHSAFLPAAVLAFVSAACGTGATGRVSAADRSFVAMVSQGGMFEVKLGTVAATQGSTQDIKDQGATEEHDHTLVGDKLKVLTGAAGLSLPEALDAKFQKQCNSLMAMSGGRFDAAYLAAMDDIHAKDGAAFAKEAADGTNPALRAFAAETHRIVLRHIGEIKALGPAS